jgi:hypothetical protein
MAVDPARRFADNALIPRRDKAYNGTGVAGQCAGGYVRLEGVRFTLKNAAPIAIRINMAAAVR